MCKGDQAFGVAETFSTLGGVLLTAAAFFGAAFLAVFLTVAFLTGRRLATAFFRLAVVPAARLVVAFFAPAGRAALRAARLTWVVAFFTSFSASVTLRVPRPLVVAAVFLAVISSSAAEILMRPACRLIAFSVSATAVRTADSAPAACF